MNFTQATDTGYANDLKCYEDFLRAHTGDLFRTRY